MASLTDNERGYEFTLEQGVIVQYDANQIGERVHVDGFDLVIKSSSVEHQAELFYAFTEWYDDDAAIEMECEKDFRKNHMFRGIDDF